MDKKVFRWDPYFRCINPNELKLQLPTGECRITIWTARNFTKWYWGYSSSLFFDDVRRPRLTDTDYTSEREAKYAALEMLIDCIDMVMYKVDNDCWCKTDSCGEVEIGYEEVLDILESVKERLQEYLKCHDNDVIFEIDDTL